ncbi:hypothetical protein [Anabaena sp. CA = ATCC 33047]|uniref:hypothetical protein n=1 Tax=Anabaena sp. (strain CA / ATCC 33047) TaxID=52271 RepID=UPI000830D2B4|nr:hypothetical protein [Anabaena sp. CA = ATCC 33047]
MQVRILEKTPTFLKLQFKPQAIFYWLFGGIFAAGGIFFIATLGKVTTFTCNRIENQPASCQLISNSFLKSQTHTWNLLEIKGAKLDTSTTDEWGSYPFLLLTNQGSFPINLINADRTKKETYATQINDFLKNSPATTLTIQEDSRFWTYPLGLLLIAAGGGCIIYMQMNAKIVCSFDKVLGKATINRQGWFSQAVTEVKLKEILGINIDAATVGRGTNYYVLLNLDNEEQIYLASGPMFTAKSAAQTVEAIASFLKLQTNV